MAVCKGSCHVAGTHSEVLLSLGLPLDQEHQPYEQEGDGERDKARQPEAAHQQQDADGCPEACTRYGHDTGGHQRKPDPFPAHLHSMIAPSFGMRARFATERRL